MKNVEDPPVFEILLNKYETLLEDYINLKNKYKTLYEEHIKLKNEINIKYKNINKKPDDDFEIKEIIHEKYSNEYMDAYINILMDIEDEKLIMSPCGWCSIKFKEKIILQSLKRKLKYYYKK